MVVDMMSYVRYKSDIYISVVTCFILYIAMQYSFEFADLFKNRN